MIIRKKLPSIKESYTTIYVIIDGQCVGYLLLSDEVRQESQIMICKIKGLKVKPVFLSGDNLVTATLIGSNLNIDDIYYEYLPEDKMEIINHYQSDNQTVGMIGDGINDAPTLKKTDIGIAMGGIGSDITVESATIVLVDDNIEEFPYLISLSKRMMNKITVEIMILMILNFIVIILAMMGILNPVVGALLYNARSLFVIVNVSLMMIEKKK